MLLRDPEVVLSGHSNDLEPHELRQFSARIELFKCLGLGDSHPTECQTTKTSWFKFCSEIACGDEARKTLQQFVSRPTIEYVLKSRNYRGMYTVIHDCIGAKTTGNFWFQNEISHTPILPTGGVNCLPYLKSIWVAFCSNCCLVGVGTCR